MYQPTPDHATELVLSLNAAIVCDDKELEAYDVKQEGTSSLRAFIASEAGKQFNITFANNLADFEVAIYLNYSSLVAPSSIVEYAPLNMPKDPDLGDAPIAPEVGTIELRAYRCQRRCVTGPSSKSTHEALHRGHVSERSKKAGWHHVAYAPSTVLPSFPLVTPKDPFSTGDEIPIRGRAHRVKVDYLDHPRKGSPYASIKVFYRPRELLRAQGIITGDDVGGQGPPISNTKRAREDESPGPSRSRTKMKKEEISAKPDALKVAKQSRTSVKRELRSPSPIVVRHAGEVVDLTLED
ncbi:hypothetical protein EDB86DRAFT_2825568 [Lactarius hatsudake]|nr:hypothetical protein EDB86DRAFT_2825568 [Lactarius hatsudake]